jgi:hypothetical protein
MIGKEQPLANVRANEPCATSNQKIHALEALYKAETIKECQA